MISHHGNFQVTRRQALQAAACGFGSLALAGLTNSAGAAPVFHHAPRAKRVIFLFMAGGVSHVDSFDHKPRLDLDDGKMMEFSDARVLANSGKVVKHRVMKSLWKFRQHGDSGHWASELFPEMAQHVDDLCFLHGMHTEGVAHGPATLFMHTGSTNQIRPSMGSWVTYGLGSDNENLPAFVSLCPSAGNGGPRNYGNAFLPAVYQGTAIGRPGIPTSDGEIRNLANAGALCRRTARTIRSGAVASTNNSSNNAARTTNSEAVINSYELAFRMQHAAPGVLDLGAGQPERSTSTASTIKRLRILVGSV